MEYIFILVILLICMLVYFKIADKYNIIDKPNHRSAHTQITLRGGGIIFPIAFILFSLFNIDLFLRDYWGFGVGLLAICTISFIDDVRDLSNKVRLSVHFISVILLMYSLGVFNGENFIPFWIWPVMFVLMIGTLNAYNFMDGINGMTGIYTLVSLCSLVYINQEIYQFVDKDIIYYPILACLVFLFFNFRKKAKCFAGDVGSMGIGFWVIGLITLLIIKTQDIKYLLLLSIYGIEVVLTIVERLKLKENIFEAHRRHLYQLFANEKKVSHLVISSVYALFQLIINAFLIHSNLSIWIILLIIFIPAGGIYLALKWILKKEYNL